MLNFFVLEAIAHELAEKHFAKHKLLAFYLLDIFFYFILLVLLSLAISLPGIVSPKHEWGLFFLLLKLSLPFAIVLGCVMATLARNLRYKKQGLSEG